MRDLLSLSQRVRLVNSALVTPEEKPLCMSLRECANNIGERLFDDVDGRIMYYDLDFLDCIEDIGGYGYPHFVQVHFYTSVRSTSVPWV